MSRFQIALRSVLCFLAAAFIFPSLLHAASEEADTTLEKVVVTATLRQQALQDVPNSVTVLDTATLHAAGVQHLEDVLGLIPNLNWAAGTSRPRYYQLRGIGELDQYQGAPNPSVGFLIEDIDFSGMGAPATLFDVDQVEVLRGPQGTTFGANALAGLIKIKTRDPKPQFEIGSEVTGATYSTEGVGAVIGGPLGIANDESAFRVVAQQYRSDGFRHNAYLDRNATNGFNELSTRAKFHLGFGDYWKLDLLGMYVDQDNGYDAFSIDNSLTTQSDYPGRDAQRSKAVEAKLTFSGWSRVNVESISTYSAIDLHYSFDDDWGNDALWQATTGYSPYNYYSNFLRQRTNRSQEIRFTSTDTGAFRWVAGLYVYRLNEANSELEFAHDLVWYPAPTMSQLLSDYSATSKAVYGQLEYEFTSANTISVGARYENRHADYNDSDGTVFSPSESMLGGQLSLTHKFASDHTAYATLSRGYKAGGFNIGADIPVEQRQFAAEYLWNTELGDRRSWLDGRLTTDATLFYMRRTNQQVSASTQLVPNDPSTFVFITSNAAHGENYGVEASAAFKLHEQWKLFGTLGLLRTRYLGYSYVDPSTGVERNLSGREQASAPEYRFSLGAEWRNASGWNARLDLSATSSFYYDVSIDQTSSAYALLNGRFGYAADTWSVSLWGRNLLNTAYATRGFYFSNSPIIDAPSELYIQRGDPRQLGLTATWLL